MIVRRVRLTIWMKLGFSFLFIAVLVALVGYISVRKSERVLTASIGEDAQRLAREVMNDIDQNIYIRSAEMQAYAQDVSLAKAASVSNSEFENIPNLQEYITTIDRDWTDRKDTPVIQDILSSEVDLTPENSNSGKESPPGKIGHSKEGSWHGRGTQRSRS